MTFGSFDNLYVVAMQLRNFFYSKNNLFISKRTPSLFIFLSRLNKKKTHRDSLTLR